MPKRKKQVSVFLIVFIFLVALLLLAIILIAIEPVTYRIYLEKKEIERGESLALTYRVQNLWPQSIKNITISIEIDSLSATQNVTHYDKANLFNSIEGNYSQNTGWIQEGNYQIETNLTYTTPFGKLKSKPLSLGFTII